MGAIPESSAIVAHLIQDMRADIEKFQKRYPAFRHYLSAIEKKELKGQSLSDFMLDESITLFLEMGVNAGFMNETMQINDDLIANRRSATTYARLLSLKQGKQADVTQARDELRELLKDRDRKPSSMFKDNFPALMDSLKIIMDAPLPFKERQEFLNKSALLGYLYRSPVVVGLDSRVYRNNHFAYSSQLHAYGKELRARAIKEMKRASRKVTDPNAPKPGDKNYVPRPVRYEIDESVLDKNKAALVNLTVPTAIGPLRAKYVVNYKRAADFYETKLSYEGEDDPINQSPAWQKIQAMIGLGDAKDMLKSFASEVLYDEVMAAAGEPVDEPTSKHFVIVGPPGTGKTVLAKMAADFLYEIGVLKEGDYHRLTRHNVLKGYVGQTDVAAKEIFARIRGSLGHVDEAYAFAKGEGSNDYGQDFINALVDHIEENRDESIYCFTGYPDKMLNFFEANEGLLSRMGCIIALGHYEASELVDIFKLQVKQLSMNIDDDALARIEGMIHEGREDADKHFGNGRFTRNIAEGLKRQLSQRNRPLLIQAKKDPSLLQDETFVKRLKTITLQDVEAISSTRMSDLKGHSMRVRLQEASKQLERRSGNESDVPGPQSQTHQARRVRGGPKP